MVRSTELQFCLIDSGVPKPIRRRAVRSRESVRSRAAFDALAADEDETVRHVIRPPERLVRLGHLGLPYGTVIPQKGTSVDLGYLLERALRAHGPNVAVSDEHRRLTYHDLEHRSARLVNALAGLGIRPGDAVVVLLSNRIEFAEIDIALARGGFVRVALNARLAVNDFLTSIDDCDARAVITETKFDQDISEIVAQHNVTWIRLGENAPSPALDYELLVQGASDTMTAPARLSTLPAWMSYTSGTTGKPKGIVLSHHALCSVIFNFGLEVGPITESSSILLTQALSHGAGYFLLAYLAAGAHALIMPRRRTWHRDTEAGPDDVVGPGATWRPDNLRDDRLRRRADQSATAR
jgi:non-ribosomal peptide synthetase component F